MPEEKTAPVTEATLKAKVAELQTASQKKDADWKALAKLATEIAAIQKGIEAAAKEAWLKEVTAIEDKVKAVIQKALQPLIDSKQLDKADGVWFSQDFGEKLIACRIMKSAAKKSGGGGGGSGKKFDVSTTDLLTKYGDKEYKDGVTFKAAWEADPDKNKRYAIRNALLKLDGQIK